jgi:hypothetical protein
VDFSDADRTSARTDGKEKAGSTAVLSSLFSELVCSRLKGGEYSGVGRSSALVSCRRDQYSSIEWSLPISRFRHWDNSEWSKYFRSRRLGANLFAEGVSALMGQTARESRASLPLIALLLVGVSDLRGWSPMLQWMFNFWYPTGDQPRRVIRNPGVISVTRSLVPPEQRTCRNSRGSTLWHSMFYGLWPRFFLGCNQNCS